MFFKKDNNKTEVDFLIKICALLVHAAKIDENYTEDEEEIDALAGDEVEAFEDTPAADTILGVDVFPVIHTKTKQKIFVSAEDIKEVDIGDLL